MKSQDVLLLLKLISLQTQDKGLGVPQRSGWQDWEVETAVARTPGSPIRTPPMEWDDRSEVHLQESHQDIARSLVTRLDDPFEVRESDDDAGSGRKRAEYSVRGLAASTGISKSQVSLSLQRCIDAGLAKFDRRDDLPRVNTKALGELLLYGVRYVFPARPGELARGIATSLGAPVLEGKLMTAGELVPVWPDARGNTKGQTIAPFAPSVPQAVRKDPRLYALLAVTDAIRIGQPRERKLASDMLMAMLKEAA